MRNTKTAVLAGLLAAAFGCAQEIGDVNRVQPDYLKKSDLAGEWYFKATLMDTGSNTTAMLFDGIESFYSEKIRWEVQEGALLGYRSYVKNPGTDGVDSHGAEGMDQPGSNTPIIGFPIMSHFDIRRQYSPATGVENNVLEENQSDRPWWERDYVRVDWSRSVIDNPMDIGGFATAYYANYNDYTSQVAEDDPYRLRILPGYIDAVTNVGVMVDLYTCIYEFGLWYSLDECGASEGKLRMSFKKVAPDSDYQPQEYPDYLPVQYRERYRDNSTALPCEPTAANAATCVRIGTCIPSTTEDEDPFCRPELYDLYVSNTGYICDENFNPDDCSQYYIPLAETFNYYRTTRWRFDPQRGYTLDGRQFLINRWNIWEKSKDADGNWIPQAERKTKPVVWYTNALYPEWLFPAAQRMGDHWDLGFREAVAAARGIDWDRMNPDDLRAKVPDRIWEVRKNDCNPDNIRAYAKDNDLEDVVVRVAGGLDKIADGNIERVCSALEYHSYGKPTPFEWQRLGDQRYNMINWVDTFNIGGPLGYGPSQADPETGEIHNGTINIYGRQMISWAQYYADIVSLMNGDLSESEVLGGEYIRSAIEAGRAKKNDMLTDREVSRVMEQVDQAMAGVTGDDYLVSVPPDDYQNRMNLIAGTALERELLVNEEILRGMAGPMRYQPGQPISDEATRLASPTRWAVAPIAPDFLPARGKNIDLKNMFGDQQRRDAWFIDHGIEMPDFFEPALAGMAHDLEGKSREEVQKYIFEMAMESVLTHEIGHTLALRHNFAASGDAMNFPREFWAIKSLNNDPQTALGQVSRLTWIPAATRDHFSERLQSCVGTRYNTQECLRIKEYMYSSIMDYGQRINADIRGISYWDRAALKMGYAMMKEAFDERQGAFLASEYDVNSALGLMDYSDIPLILANTDMGTVFWDSANAISDATTQVVTLPAKCDLDGNGPAGCIQPGYENIYKRRDVKFSDYVDDFHRDMFTSGYEELIREVPYSYCGEMYAWGGNLFCNKWDLGANVTEIVGNATELYNNYYLMTNFRRDRYTWGDVNAYLSRLYARTFQPVRYAYNYYYYYRNTNSRMWPLINDWATAAFNGLNFLGSILQMPEPGSYCLCASNCQTDDLRPLPDNTYVPMTGATCPAGTPMTVGRGEGRYFNSMWTPDYFYKPLSIGSIWDKIVVLETMTDSSAYFARDISGWFDRGSYSITYYRVFNEEMIELFKGMIEGDSSKYASEVREVGGKLSVVPRRIVGQQPGAPAPLIVPADNYFLRFYAMYFSLLGLTSTVDRHLDFIDRARVHLAGEANEPVYAGIAPAEMAVFINPQNNYTYRAAPIDALRDPGTGVIVDTSRCIGYEYVQRAANYATTSWQPAKDALTAAQAACTADAQCTAANPNNAAWQALVNAEEAFARVDRRMTDISENLDTLRMFVNLLPFSFL